jgi:hypothetical protein
VRDKEDDMNDRLSRRGFLKGSAIALGAFAATDLKCVAGALAAPQEESRVYFTKEITGDGLVKAFSRIGRDCDCAGVRAAPPKVRDLGILASTDILAVDQASIDMVYMLPEDESHDLRERIESRKGLRQLIHMKELGMGNGRYELVELKRGLEEQCRTLP